jgi:hypothetical protein
MNQEIEKQTAITRYAERNGVIPLKPRFKNKVICGFGMSNILNKLS